MNPAILILMAQALAAVAMPAANASRPSGVRVTALATVEILPAATTRDGVQDRQVTRHRRTGSAGEITLEFE
ncbi:MAG: hypothetical protein ACKOOL_00425 [Novosphingobium sp.]